MSHDLRNHSWSLHDDGTELWIESNDEDNLVVADMPQGITYTDEQYAACKEVFERIIELHNTALLISGVEQ